MKFSKLGVGLSAAAMSLLLVAAPSAGNAKSMHHDNMDSSMQMKNMDNNHGHMGMMMKQNGSKDPKDLKVANNAEFKKGQKITINTDHMNGMKGAKGKVVNAYQSPLYAINFKTTNGGQQVKDHKWLVNKELKTNQKGQLKVGDKVTLDADHMSGMKGAKATIVGVHKAPAYMVNFRSTDGMNFTNHKWLAQDEIQKR